MTDMQDNKEKRTFKSIISNIWYYYKWFILVGVCLLIMITVGLVQMFSKVAPDAFVYYVGKEGPTAKAVSDFCTDLQDLMPKDFNGDGQKKVDYKEDIFIMYSIDNDIPDGGSYVYNSTDQANIIQRFNIELAMGECVIYIMEPNLFKANTAYIEPLENILGSTSDNAVLEKGFKISELSAYKSTALSSFPDDCVICVRARRKGDDKAFYNANVETFKALVGY